MRIGLGIGLDFTKKRGVLIAPVATAATSVTGTSFVANWNAYDGATTYYLDVSTSPTFATFVLQNQSVSAPATSYTVTGLTACTYYYYRVRAEGNKPTISIAPTLSPSGTQFTGTLITCGTGTWNSQGSTFNYQWKRNGVSISGATSSTYTLQVADEGTTITCEVQNQNAFGKSPYVVTSNSVSATAFQGVLDLYPNASVAYSVRKLRAAYTGSAIRVRRSSDNTEQDIGFTGAGNLDETALTTFVGANDGFVTTWYDQSGNANHATQTTAIRQPPIVRAGVVEKVNGKVAADYNSAGLLFHSFTSSVIAATNMLIYNVGQRTAASKVYSPFGASNTIFGYFSNNVLYFYGAEAWAGSTYTTTGQLLILGTANPTNYKFYQNNINLPVFLSVATYSGRFDFVNNYASAGQSGRYQEGIIWNIDRTSDRAGITTNVNTYYGIF